MDERWVLVSTGDAGNRSLQLNIKQQIRPAPKIAIVIVNDIRNNMVLSLPQIVFRLTDFVEVDACEILYGLSAIPMPKKTIISQSISNKKVQNAKTVIRENHGGIMNG